MSDNKVYDMDDVNDFNYGILKSKYDALQRKLEMAKEALRDLQKIEYLGEVGRARAKLALQKLEA